MSTFTTWTTTVEFGGVSMSTSKLMELKSGPCSAKGIIRGKAPKPFVQVTVVPVPVIVSVGGSEPPTPSYVVDGEPQLLEVVGALHPPCGLAGGLDRGEQQCDEDADDGDDHQQLNQGEAT